MISDSAYMFYQKWTETEEYFNQSCLENDIYREMKDKMTRSVGEDKYDELSDDIIGF